MGYKREVRSPLLTALGCLATLGSSGLSLAQPPELITPTVVAELPHDTGAFTQGLLWHGEYLYESTGLYGSSSLRQVDPNSGDILLQVALNDAFFAEGLARVPDRDGGAGWNLIQLTWREHVALVYDLQTFELLDTLAYDGEGWGLCYDGTRLVMSDGSARLSFRDPVTFEVIGSVEVTNGGAPADRLNELECAGSDVFANVWFTDTILRIDPTSGEVTATFDASGLLSADEAVNADALNGIAVRPDSGHLLVTGKRWPKLFELDVGAADGEVSEEPPGGCAGAPNHDRWWAGLAAAVALLLLRWRGRVDRR